MDSHCVHHRRLQPERTLSVAAKHRRYRTGAWRHRNCWRHRDPAGLCRDPDTPPPAFPPGGPGVREAIGRIIDLRRAGFGFLHHRDERGEVVMVQAVRVRAGHIETVLIHGEH
ncbi:MAG: hypothetical protein ACRDRZ_18565, partial [Pseudonocardiaceae bacterium]